MKRVNLPTRTKKNHNNKHTQKTGAMHIN